MTEIDDSKNYELALRVRFDMSTIRKAAALIMGGSMTEEDIKEKFINRDPSILELDELNVDDDKKIQACMSLLVMMISGDKQVANAVEE